MWVWEETMSGPLAEDGHVDGVDQWGKFRCAEEEAMSGCDRSMQGVGVKGGGDGWTRA